MSVTKRFRVDGWADFTLEFRRGADGTYSIWCLDHPTNAHGGGVSDHHLYSDRHVCIAEGREPRTLDRAIAIAHVFMKSFAHWCQTGKHGRTGGRVNV